MTPPTPHRCTYGTPPKPGWYILLPTGEPKKYRRIHRRTKDEIIEAAKENADVLLKFGVNGIISDADRRYLLRCKDYAASFNVDILEAIRFYAKHGGETLVKMALGNAVEKFMGIKQRVGRSDAYVQNIGWTTTQLRKHFGDEREIHTLSLQEIEEWADGRAWTSLGTRKRQLGNVRMFLNFCKKKQWTLLNVLRGMEFIQVNNKRPNLLTVDQCRALLKSAMENHRRLLPHLAVQLFTGLRYNECMNRLTPDHFKSDCIDLEAEDTKMRQRRLVPINDTLRAWLAIEPFKRIKDHTHSWVALKRSAVDPWPQNAIRHTAATMLFYKYGASEAARILGHTEAMLIGTYKGRIAELGDVEKFWNLKPSSLLQS